MATWNNTHHFYSIKRVKSVSNDDVLPSKTFCTVCYYCSEESVDYC